MTLVSTCDQMVRQRSGMVAHSNSLAGLMGLLLQGPSSAAKGAMRLLMDVCLVEFAGHGSRVVSLSPGFVATARAQTCDMPSPFAISQQRGVARIIHGPSLRTAAWT